MAEYVVPENPQYNTNIREVENGDPARASVLNIVIQQIIENIAAVKALADNAQHTADAQTEGVNAIAGRAEAAAEIASMAIALLGDSEILAQIGTSAIPTAWYNGGHTALRGKLMVNEEDITNTGTPGTQIEGLKNVWLSGGTFYTRYGIGGTLSEPIDEEGRWLLQDRFTGNYYDYEDGEASAEPVTEVDGVEIITPSFGTFYKGQKAVSDIPGTAILVDAYFVWAGDKYVEVDISELRSVYSNLRAELDGIQARLLSLEKAYGEVL